MASLKDELTALIDGSLSIAALGDKEQKAVRDRLLALPEEEMKKPLKCFRKNNKNSTNR